MVIPTVAVLATVALGGCGETAGTTSTTTLGSSTSTRAARHSHPGHHRRRHRRTTRRHLPGTLVASRASSHVAAPQPPPGSCHARGSGVYSQPDRSCTPGAINPAVTQGTIDRTICVSGWTETVRPPESVTEPEKVASMAAYGDTGPRDDYEYDHLVPLELGGAVNDARNLWPEPGGSPNLKDEVENALRRMVCDGAMALRVAQRIMATGWVTWARRDGFGPPSVPRPARSPKPKSQPVSSSAPGKPVADVNCSDFTSHASAQRWFEQHGGSPSRDVAGLDRDHDGLACESLP